MAGHHLDDATYKKQVAAVWKSTVILAVVTIAEVAIALLWPFENRFILNMLFILMSGAKAFFIMGEFMHLKYEKRALVLSILVPFLFLVWGIIAFMMDGESWGNMREFWPNFFS